MGWVLSPPTDSTSVKTEAAWRRAWPTARALKVQRRQEEPVELRIVHQLLQHHTNSHAQVSQAWARRNSRVGRPQPPYALACVFI